MNYHVYLACYQQASPKESRERRAKLWESAEGQDERRGTEGWQQSKVTDRERE